MHGLWLVVFRVVVGGEKRLGQLGSASRARIAVFFVLSVGERLSFHVLNWCQWSGWNSCYAL